jgi:hypothetical protein
MQSSAREEGRVPALGEAEGYPDVGVHAREGGRGGTIGGWSGGGLNTPVSHTCDTGRGHAERIAHTEGKKKVALNRSSGRRQGRWSPRDHRHTGT